MRAFLPLLVLLLSANRLAAQPDQNPLNFIQTGQWPQARSAAAKLGNPLGEKLVTYYRMLAPNAASAAEIAAFSRQNPDWPMPSLIERRRQEAIATDPDSTAIAAVCKEKPPAKSPAWGPALFRCADILANPAMARQAWVEAIADAATEAAFQRRFPAPPAPADQWARFQRLAWNDTDAARRQIANLDQAQTVRATAWLALKNGGAFTPNPAEEPGAVLDLARAYRRGNQTAAAVALWRASGTDAQKAAPDHLAEFWSERHQLARKLIQDGDARGAYTVISAHGQTDPALAVEGEFLAGFLALRRLNDPAAAERHFTALAAASPAVLTQSRAFYWLGRTHQAAGGDGKAAFLKAVAWPMTFYGQLAFAAAGLPDDALVRALRTMTPPAVALAVTPTTGELANAARLLLSWGDPRRARPFLLRIEEIARTPAERIAAGDYAGTLGLPDIQVSIARRLGRDGLIPPPQGWPAPYDPPTVVDPSFSLAIMRQESNFDLAVVSSSGARGLMQLMPATAASVARRLGEATSLPRLTSDADHNMRLGTAYLREVADRFDGAVPLAAAYNAGPHRVTQWLGEYGDPRTTGAMIDWIETIPFNETRNYVQRVLENLVVYQARRAGTLPAAMRQWSR